MLKSLTRRKKKYIFLDYLIVLFTALYLRIRTVDMEFYSSIQPNYLQLVTILFGLMFAKIGRVWCIFICANLNLFSIYFLSISNHIIFVSSIYKLTYDCMILLVICHSLNVFRDKGIQVLTYCYAFGNYLEIVQLLINFKYFKYFLFILIISLSLLRQRCRQLPQSNYFIVIKHLCTIRILVIQLIILLFVLLAAINLNIYIGMVTSSLTRYIVLFIFPLYLLTLYRNLKYINEGILIINVIVTVLLLFDQLMIFLMASTLIPHILILQFILFTYIFQEIDPKISRMVKYLNYDAIVIIHFIIIKNSYVYYDSYKQYKNIIYFLSIIIAISIFTINFLISYVFFIILLIQYNIDKQIQTSISKIKIFAIPLKVSRNIIILMINLRVQEMMILCFEYFIFYKLIFMKLTQEIKFSLQKTQKVISIQMDVHHIQGYIKKFKNFILPGSRWQQESENTKSLNTTFQEPFPDDLQEFIKQNNCQILEKDVIIGYDDMTYNEVLQQLLPQNVSAPQGYEIIGKIAHFNLSPEQLPYRYLIGQVLLDKNKHLQTVCNKLEKLHNVYRTPQLELLAGKNSYDAIVLLYIFILIIPEGGIRLFLNFEKVYWCTRLYSERERIIKFIKELSNGKQIKILDLFCGIGPFSLRIANDLKAKCLANDLNPECFYYLKKNIVENKVFNQVIPLNMDAREVVLKIYAKEIDFDFNHVYMNLPVLAINFLDVFKGFTQKTGKVDLPYIHVYGFAKGKDDQELIEQFSQRIIKCLPGFDKTQILRFHILKNVTKMKKMCCLSFQLDKKSAESDFGLLEQEDGNNSDYEDDEKIEQNEQIEEVINKKVKID